MQITESCLSGMPTLCSVFTSHKRSKDRKSLGCLFSCCTIFTMVASRDHYFTVHRKKWARRHWQTMGRTAIHSCTRGWKFNDLLLFDRQAKERKSGRGIKWANAQLLLYLCPTLSPLAKLSKQPLIQRGNWGDALKSFLKLGLLK